MRFQSVKCNIMQITRKRTKKTEASHTLEGKVLENVDSITITHDLKWNTHISYMCTLVSRNEIFISVFKM